MSWTQPLCPHQVVRFMFDVLSDGSQEYHQPVYRCESCDQRFGALWEGDKRPAPSPTQDHRLNELVDAAKQVVARPLPMHTTHDHVAELNRLATAAKAWDSNTPSPCEEPNWAAEGDRCGECPSCLRAKGGNDEATGDVDREEARHHAGVGGRGVRPRVEGGSGEPRDQVRVPDRSGSNDIQGAGPSRPSDVGLADTASPGACGRCGKDPADGWALINVTRYCHEGPSPTCYELESWMPRTTEAPAPTEGVDQGRNERSAVAGSTVAATKDGSEEGYGGVDSSGPSAASDRDIWHCNKCGYTDTEGPEHDSPVLGGRCNYTAANMSEWERREGGSAAPFGGRRECKHGLLLTTRCRFCEEGPDDDASPVESVEYRVERLARRVESVIDVLDLHLTDDTHPRPVQREKLRADVAGDDGRADASPDILDALLQQVSDRRDDVEFMVRVRKSVRKHADILDRLRYRNDDGFPENDVFEQSMAVDDVPADAEEEAYYLISEAQMDSIVDSIAAPLLDDECRSVVHQVLGAAAACGVTLVHHSAARNRSASWDGASPDPFIIEERLRKAGWNLSVGAVVAVLRAAGLTESHGDER